MSQTQLIFEKQWLHALLAGMVLVTDYDGVRAGRLWRVTTLVWLWLAVGLAITHQIERRGFLGLAATVCIFMGSSCYGFPLFGGRR
jgi:hypothetical protein